MICKIKGCLESWCLSQILFGSFVSLINFVGGFIWHVCFTGLY